MLKEGELPMSNNEMNYSGPFAEEEGLHEKRAPSVSEERVPRISKPLMVLFYIGAFVAVFVTGMQIVVPASFFVYAAQKWGVDVSSLWLMASYLIGYVSFGLPAYRVSEHTGRLAMFWFGLAVFVIFTGVVGHSSTSYTFSVLRAFQGIGAAIVTSMVMLVVGAHGSDRNRALAVSGLCAAQLLGVGAAHAIGGKLAVDGHFRWGMYMAAPLMAAPAVLCTPALVFDRKSEHKESLLQSVKRFDYVGTLLLFGAAIMTTMGLTYGGNEYPWKSAMTLCLLVFGCVCIALFLGWEGFGPASRPILNPRWLRERNLQITIWATILFAMVFISMSVYVPILYITARNQPTDVAGRRAAPFWGMNVGGALLAGVVMRARPSTARYFVWGGLVLGAIFTGLYYTIPFVEDLPKERAFYAMAGLGIGIAYPAINYIAQVSVPVDESASAAVISHFLSIVGGMFGLILYQACLKSRLIHNMTPVFNSNSLLATFNIASMDIAALEASGPTLLVYVPSMTTQVGQKLVDSMRTTFILSVPFLGAALIATLLYKQQSMRT